MTKATKKPVEIDFYTDATSVHTIKSNLKQND